MVDGGAAASSGGREARRTRARVTEEAFDKF